MGPRGAEGGQGDDGADGEDGADGIRTLIITADEAAGVNCEFGGVRVQTGPDANADGTLDSVTATTFFCDGSPGVQAIAGFRLVSKYTAPGGPIAEIVSASPDGNTLVYTSSGAQTVGFANIGNPAQPTLLGTTNVAAVTGGDGEPTAVAFAPSGQHVLAVVKDTANPVANTDPGYLVVIDASTRSIVGQRELGVGPDSLALTPDGTKAVIAIEDEENEGGNNAPQARTGKVQIVTIDYAVPASSTVVDVLLPVPATGNMPTDLQPEYVDIDPTGTTAIVSLQENNLVAVIDLASASVARYIDAGTSVHARADLLNDRAWSFTQPYTGQLQPDGVCFLPDGVHFITANEGDTSNGVFPAAGPVFAGGRGFSVFHTGGTRVYDSGDTAEWVSFRSGAYPDSRSANRGMEPEGCGTGRFGGSSFAFVTGERNSSVLVLDVTQPKLPVVRQILGAPNRPESATAIESRGLFVVGGEGDGAVAGGGIWIYEAVTDPADVGHGSEIYDARTSGLHSFGALSALAYEPSTGFLLGIADNAYATSRIWSFEVDHAARRLTLVDELVLTDASATPLAGIDPEGLVVNPEGGFIVATEGTAGNGGGGATCTGGPTSNRILFFTAAGSLDSSYGVGGIVDLPCGTDPQAFDWSLMGSNGFEGVTVVDATPGSAGGLKVYVAFQRPLTGEAPDTRIGEYDVDSETWSFYFYPLDPDVGGPSGNTFLSELIWVEGVRFAVIERDQGYAAAALNKTIRTFTLSSGAVNDVADPVEKTLTVDLLAAPFRFDQEKLEGLAFGGGSLFVVNDNDGGTAQSFFLRLSPHVFGASGTPFEIAPDVVISEVNSTGTSPDFVELHNRESGPVDVGDWVLEDGGGGTHTIAASTTIAANGYLLLDALSFGLGSADSVTVRTALGTLVGSHAWTAHVSSESRCGSSGLVFWPTNGMNGAGLPTPGAANDCTGPTVAGEADVVVNEVNSSGNDFVELYNTGLATVDLSHWKITDSDPTHVLVLPVGTMITAGGYLVIEGDWTTTPPALSFGLGMGDSVILYSPYDQEADNQTWSGHAATASRCPNGTGALLNPTTDTKGALNSCP
jgi:hypothetical protein